MDIEKLHAESMKSLLTYYYFQNQYRQSIYIFPSVSSPKKISLTCQKFPSK